VLSGGVGAASFPPVEQTISKVSQQRRQKREGGRKTGRKQVEKGLQKSRSYRTAGQKVEKVQSGKSRRSSPQRSSQAGDEGGRQTVGLQKPQTSGLICLCKIICSSFFEGFFFTHALINGGASSATTSHTPDKACRAP